MRDWATFGLAEMVAADSAAIRAALRARLSDTHENIRAEAIWGLARRKEAGLIPLLLRELEDWLSTPLLNAAAELASPALCDALAAAEGGIGRWHVRAAWDEARARGTKRALSAAAESAVNRFRARADIQRPAPNP